MRGVRWGGWARGAWCLAIAALAVSGCVPRKPASDSESKEAVVQVLEDQRQAWNRGDLDEFMTGYWNSDSLTFFGGAEVRQGWNATRERYRQRYQSGGAEMGQLDFDIHDVTITGPRHAVVRGAFRLTRKADAPHGIFTLVLRRFPTGWKIVHDHTSAATE